jgi:hypothetical protein
MIEIESDPGIFTWHWSVELKIGGKSKMGGGGIIFFHYSHFYLVAMTTARPDRSWRSWAPIKTFEYSAVECNKSENWERDRSMG